MSTLCKLEIRGVRSFGVDDSQKLKFHSPLTLIVGQNGCGKTTIIECLKYALTGEFPPGTSGGKQFVHDPNIFNAVECLGQVKLMIKDYLGNKVTCTRSMKVVPQKGKTKFTSLDGTITYEGKDGKNTTITKRIAEINSEMCDFMGVSKAIINSVLFCHQDDSNWPLDEGKKLKEKFDAIFGTTEYNRTIERLIKFGKLYSDKQREKQGDLKLLRHLKEDTLVKSQEIIEKDGKLNNLQMELESLSDLEIPIKCRIKEIMKVMQNISTLNGKQIEIETRIQNCIEQQNKLRSNIRNIFDGSLTCIVERIHMFENTLKQKEEKLDSIGSQLNEKKLSELSLQKKLKDFEVEYGKLVTKRQIEQEAVANRAVLVKELCNRLDVVIDGDINNNNEAFYIMIIQNIELKIKSEQFNLMEMKKIKDIEENKLQLNIDGLRDKKTRNESNYNLKQKQLKESSSELKNIENDIINSEKSALKLNDLLKDIEKIDKEYENFTKSMNLEKDRNDLSAMKIKKRNLEERLEKIDSNIQYLNSIAKVTTKLDMKRTTLNEKQTDLKRIKNKHIDNFSKLFPERVIENNYKRNIQLLYDKLHKEHNNLIESMNKLQYRVAELEASRKNGNSLINKFEKDIKDCEEIIYNECHGENYEDIVTKSKEKLERYQIELATSKSSDLIFKEYSRKIGTEACCPVCHKDMKSNEINTITEEISDKISRLPDKIEHLNALIKTEQVKYDKLLYLNQHKERINSTKTELSKTKANLKETLEALLKTNNNVENLQIDLSNLKSLLQLTNSMIGDMVMIDEILKDSEMITSEMRELEKGIPSGSVNIDTNLEDAQVEKATLNAEVKYISKEIDDFQYAIDSKNEKLNHLRDTRNQMQTQKIKLQESFQSLKHLKEKKALNNDKVKLLELELNEIEKNLSPFEKNLKIEIENMRQLKCKNSKNIDDFQQKINNTNTKYMEILRVSKDIEELNKLNLCETIKDIKQKIDLCSQEKNNMVKTVESLSLDLDNIKEEIGNHCIIERELQDNHSLLILQKDEGTLKNTLAKIKLDISELSYEKINDEHNELKEREDSLFSKKSRIKGQISELHQQIEASKKELLQPKYKNALKNFLQINNEVSVLKNVIRDITKYRCALEWALTKYHSEKMEQINRIIVSLWRDIYRGNDIDYIKIKTHDPNEKTTADKRRTFLYRVVQSKNEVEMDMRGRCSAGQKVLASLIIRMALAETFSNNCGILTLDEPTTNLDQENIGSLCDALRRIVNERDTGNFMLVVITHDEKFVRALDRLESYYRISRNTQGKSKITEEVVTTF